MVGKVIYPSVNFRFWAFLPLRKYLRFGFGGKGLPLVVHSLIRDGGMVLLLVAQLLSFLNFHEKGSQCLIELTVLSSSLEEQM